MAKQIEDTKTLEFPELPVVARRGRGRPRIENALTPAERAKAYRARKKQRTWRAANMPPVKYRDPDTGQTWSGRGLAPKWITCSCIRLDVDRSHFLVKP